MVPLGGARQCGREALLFRTAMLYSTRFIRAGACRAASSSSHGLMPVRQKCRLALSLETNCFRQHGLDTKRAQRAISSVTSSAASCILSTHVYDPRTRCPTQGTSPGKDAAPYALSRTANGIPATGPHKATTRTRLCANRHSVQLCYKTRRRPDTHKPYTKAAPRC